MSFIQLRDVSRYEALFDNLISQFDEILKDLNKGTKIQKHQDVTQQLYQVFEKKQFKNLGDVIFHKAVQQTPVSTEDTSNASPVMEEHQSEEEEEEQEEEEEEPPTPVVKSSKIKMKKSVRKPRNLRQKTDSENKSDQKFQYTPQNDIRRSGRKKVIDVESSVSSLQSHQKKQTIVVAPSRVIIAKKRGRKLQKIEDILDDKEELKEDKPIINNYTKMIKSNKDNISDSINIKNKKHFGNIVASAQNSHNV